MGDYSLQSQAPSAAVGKCHSIIKDKVVIILHYQEITEYIEEIPKFSTKHPLEHTRKLLASLGNPQDQFRVIHVAGTNGKGSTCAYLASMFKAGGISCGFFTSPHLVDIRERFQIDGQMASREDFTEVFNQVKEKIDEMVAAGEGHPSYFETLFVMGMLYFQKKHVDFCVLETGLGGRLDATNSVKAPLATIITSISLDHTEILGDTIEQIAGEKAGIIKPKIPIIYDGHVPAAANVIREQAKRMDAPAYELTEDMYHIEENTREGIRFTFHSCYCEDTVLKIPYVAPYQMMNAALAFLTMLVLQPVHGISLKDLIRGIETTSWPGRMETVRPGVILDGAHNADGVARFVETAEHFSRQCPVTLLFSAVADKDYEKMIESICEKIHPGYVVTTQVGGHREVRAEDLAVLFRQHGCSRVESESDVGKAYTLAESHKGDGLLFCVGSLYLVGEIKAFLAAQEGSTDD